MIWANFIPRFLEHFNLIPNNEIENLLNNYSPILLFIILVIIGPLAEEAIFRLNLKQSRSNIIISLIIVLGYIIFRICLGNTNYTKITVLLLLYVLMLLVSYSNKFLNKNPQKYFRFVFYFSAIAFAFMHVFNYSELTTLTLLLFPLITLPQMLIGLISGFLRMNYGFIFGVLFHSLINFLAFIFLFLQNDLL